MPSDSPLTRVCYLRVEELPTGPRYTVVFVPDISNRFGERTRICADIGEVLHAVEGFLRESQPEV